MIIIAFFQKYDYCSKIVAVKLMCHASFIISFRKSHFDFGSRVVWDFSTSQMFESSSIMHQILPQDLRLVCMQLSEYVLQFFQGYSDPITIRPTVGVSTAPARHQTVEFSSKIKAFHSKTTKFRPS